MVATAALPHRPLYLGTPVSSCTAESRYTFQWTVLEQVSPRSVPFRGESALPFNTGFLSPCTRVCHQNGISVGSSDFAGLFGVPNTDHATCDLCNNRPQLCSARDVLALGA